MQESRIFVVERGESRSNFVFFPLGAAFERGVDVGFGVIDFWESHAAFAAAQGVAGVRVFELHDRSDVAGAQSRNTGAGLSVEEINLANLLGAGPSGVIKLAPELDEIGRAS